MEEQSLRPAVRCKYSEKYFELMCNVEGRRNIIGTITKGINYGTYYYVLWDGNKAAVPLRKELITII